MVPTARAAQLTMNREGIRRLVAEELPASADSPYHFCRYLEDYRPWRKRARRLPLRVKPIMSSSGKGQSVLKGPDDLEAAWDYAQEGGRTQGRVIVEGFIDFDYEITLLTTCATSTAPWDRSPPGHRAITMSPGSRRAMIAQARPSPERVAWAVTEALGDAGYLASNCSSRATRWFQRCRRDRTIPAW